MEGLRRIVLADASKRTPRWRNAFSLLLDEPELFSDADDIDEDFEPAEYHGVHCDYEDPNEDD
jgi:hypothetical protein